MTCLMRGYATIINLASRYCSSRCLLRSSSVSPLQWSLNCSAVTENKLHHLLRNFPIQSYSSRTGKRNSSGSQKIKLKPTMDNDVNAYFVVRKGDIIGIYKSFSDCQSQLGSSICDPPVSVYKGYFLPKETEKYLAARGLKNPMYAIRAADLKDDLFSALVPCPFQQPKVSKSELSMMDLPMKRSREALELEIEDSCIVEFDGASRGNPGRAGAGALIRAKNGNLLCRLREGLGTATCNAAEYRAVILGLKYALEHGYAHIRLQGDSRLVCMQLQGLWKVKSPNLSLLHGSAKKLMEKFLSLEVHHVLRGSNSEADAQANLATDLPDGLTQEEPEVAASLVT